MARVDGLVECTLPPLLSQCHDRPVVAPWHGRVASQARWHNYQIIPTLGPNLSPLFFVPLLLIPSSHSVVSSSLCTSCASSSLSFLLLCSLFVLILLASFIFVCFSLLFLISLLACMLSVCQRLCVCLSLSNFGLMARKFLENLLWWDCSPWRTLENHHNLLLGRIFCNSRFI